MWGGLDTGRSDTPLLSCLRNRKLYFNTCELDNTDTSIEGEENIDNEAAEGIKFSKNVPIQPKPMNRINQIPKSLIGQKAIAKVSIFIIIILY